MARKLVRPTKKPIGGLTRKKREKGMRNLTGATNPRPGYGKATPASRTRPRKR